MSDATLPDPIDNADPVANAKALQRLMQAIKAQPVAEQFASARLLLPKSSESIDDLLDFIIGLQHGNAAALKRLERLVFELLSAMQPLYAKEVSAFGRPSEMRQWLQGTAPRLRETFDRASAFLGIEWIDMSSEDDAAKAS